MKVGGTFLVRCGQGDNSARHCFVLTDLNPMNFFKYVIIMKMCTTDKIFGKICLKASRDIFFQMLSAIKGGMGWDIKARGRTQCPAIATNRKPPKKTEWQWVFFFKAANLQHVRLEMEKSWQNLWCCSIYISLSIHFKVRSI